MSVPNLFEQIPESLPDELVEILATGQACRIERIVSTGHVSPPGFWYDQEWDEVVVVLKGSARVRFEDGSEHSLVQGSCLHIRAHLKHRVEFTSEQETTVWLAIHFAG